MKRTKQDFMVNGIVVPEETETAIYGLFGKYRCLSNFHPHSFEFEGLTYSCSEAAYMAQKTEDLEVRKFFASLKDPKDAKHFGREVELRKDWDEVHRIHAMYKVCFAKFYQDEESLKILLSTKNKYIEETNWWKDKFWGVYAGEGRNNLGHVLMTIRDFFSSTSV